jgi:hypothetical protein
MGCAVRVRATIELHGKAATGIELPGDVVSALGGGKRPKVKVTINGYTYPSTVGIMGGAFLIPVSAEVRAKAGVAAGDEVDIDLVPDDEPRVVEVPSDLAAALDQAPGARQAYGQLSYSAQRRHVLSVEQAKTAPTRQRRIEAVIAELTARP